MKKILIYDFETTGKAEFKLPAGHPSQPHVVQLGALMIDEEGNEIQYVNLIVKPESWVVPVAASNIHGITHEMALDRGIPKILMLGVLMNLIKISDLVVGHNIAFDDFVLQSEMMRNGKGIPPYDTFCTMTAMTKVCQLSGGRYGDYKWPKLSEAYEFAFGEELQGAHDAMVDVRATAKLYLWYKKYEATPGTPKLVSVLPTLSSNAPDASF